MCQNTCLAYSWAKSWNTVKHWFSTLVLVWLTGSCGLPALPKASWENIIVHIISPGKENDAKFKEYFLLNLYHFHTMRKLKSISQSIVKWRNINIQLLRHLTDLLKCQNKDLTLDQGICCILFLYLICIFPWIIPQPDILNMPDTVIDTEVPKRVF